jgi:hypothetical protein
MEASVPLRFALQAVFRRMQCSRGYWDQVDVCVCSACPLVRGPTLILTGYCTIIYYDLRRVDRCEKQKQEEKYRGN